jgi:UPF0176 protein
MNYWVLAYYKFTHIEHPEEVVSQHHAFFADKDITCRIYVSSEGINGQLSGRQDHAQEYIDWFKRDARFSDVEIKIHHWHENVFPRKTVKLKSQIVALDAKVDPAKGGDHVEPEQWKEMLESRDDKTLVLDVRNDYEWEVGHFEGATLPDLDKFRDFTSYAKQLKESRDPKVTKVMMYCTGGIRCELYSALLKQEGFEKVFQLQGGVIKYGQKMGTDDWRGKLFVFDDRLTIAIDEKEGGEVISQCRHCGELSDLYYNCANMDCNDLFICCPECAEKMKGCCSETCESAPRLRPFIKTERPKPFRRQHELTQETAPSSHSEQP